MIVPVVEGSGAGEEIEIGASGRIGESRTDGGGELGREASAVGPNVRFTPFVNTGNFCDCWCSGGIAGGIGTRIVGVACAVDALVAVVLRLGGSDDVHVTYHHLSLLEGTFNPSHTWWPVGTFA